AWIRFWMEDSPQMNREDSPRMNTDEHGSRAEGSRALSSSSNLRSSVFIRGGNYEQTVLSVDPAVSSNPGADRTALVTLGKTATNQIHCLDALARRVSAPELMQLIDDDDR